MKVGFFGFGLFGVVYNACVVFDFIFECCREGYFVIGKCFLSRKFGLFNK